MSDDDTSTIRESQTEGSAIPSYEVPFHAYTGVKSMLDLPSLDSGNVLSAIPQASIIPLLGTAYSPTAVAKPYIARRYSSQASPTDFRSKITFDDIPGLRKRSLTGSEAKRLVTISMEAASRAHHHWLRPCAACSRRLAEEKAEKKSKIMANGSVEDLPGDQTRDKGTVGKVYKHTLHWVRKESRTKQP
jgi:hypothetical protein